MGTSFFDLVHDNASSVVNKAVAVCTNEGGGLLISISSLRSSPADWLLLLKVVDRKSRKRVVRVMRKKEATDRFLFLVHNIMNDAARFNFSHRTKKCRLNRLRLLKRIMALNYAKNN